MSADVADVADPLAGPRQELLARALEAMAEADKRLRQVVVAELEEGLPAFEQDEAEKAAALGVAYAAVQDPERDLAAIGAEIAAAVADRDKWAARLTDETPREQRARARFQHSECEADITRLTQKREFADAQLLPLRAAVTKARNDLAAATAAKDGARLNATEAFAFYAAGQKTAGYVWRFGMALEAILRDEDHWEHAAAIEHMLHLCRVSGFRTEDYPDQLPSEAEQGRRFWDSVYADAASRAAADPSPSGADIAAMTVAEITNKTLPQTSHIDDYRDPRTAVPRNVQYLPERSWMTPPQSVREMGLR